MENKKLHLETAKLYLMPLNSCKDCRATDSSDRYNRPTVCSATKNPHFPKYPGG